ncbi:MAG: hypothetical protein JJT85_08100 [Chromatiales bacterium]|nr:hypothetical protein [Chromatiales bacterium]
MLKTRIPALLLALLAGAAAQALPDFSGTWVLDPAQGGDPGHGAAVQETLEITQTPTALVVTHLEIVQGRTRKRTVTYDLTGSPVNNEQARGEVSETITSVVGDELMTTWTSEAAQPGRQTTRTETRALSTDGRTMTVTLVGADQPPRVRVYLQQP